MERVADNVSRRFSPLGRQALVVLVSAGIDYGHVVASRI